MTDPTSTPSEPDNFGDLPIQPTGSGVADLEVAYEQMRLADDDDRAPGAEFADETAAAIPTEDGADSQASAAHPS